MAVAVICELNPFHNGHRYLVRQARAITGEGVIAVMSGSFTQRGEAAVTDKFFRAETALQNGVDLVAELPAAYAVANAQRFARGGAALARSFDCVRYLAFGCECADIGLLRQAALAGEEPQVQARVKTLMQEGLYYPRALEQAAAEVMGEKVAQVLREPNNILAVEYLRALRGSDIIPLPIRRVAVAHDSAQTSGAFASASHIRTLLRSGRDAQPYLPRIPEQITEPQLLDRAVLGVLRTGSEQLLRTLPDVNEGLEHRILEAAKTAPTLAALADAVKTKRYTHARIRRILTCAFLGITEQLQSSEARYARILGFTPEGAAMLPGCSFEIVTSAAKCLASDSPNRPFLRADIRATDLAALAYRQVRPCGADYHTKIIRVIRAN